jgi:hypothetical protein
LLEEISLEEKNLNCLAAKRQGQTFLPHTGVREALLAPTAAPALPDVARSSSDYLSVTL